MSGKSGNPPVFCGLSSYLEPLFKGSTVVIKYYSISEEGKVFGGFCVNNRTSDIIPLITIPWSSNSYKSSILMLKW